MLSLINLVMIRLGRALKRSFPVVPRVLRPFGSLPDRVESVYGMDSSGRSIKSRLENWILKSQKDEKKDNKKKNEEDDDDEEEEEDEDGKVKEKTVKDLVKEFFNDDGNRKKILYVIGGTLLVLSFSEKTHELFGVEFGMYPKIGIEVGLGNRKGTGE